jgi:ABC-type hemin transport system ATPase subunit
MSMRRVQNMPLIPCDTGRWPALLGNTGSRKSTLIQAISGKSLHRAIHSRKSAAGVLSDREAGL